MKLLVACLAPVLVAALLAANGAHAQEVQKKMPDLIRQVLDKQPAAAMTAKSIGPSANPELIKLTRNDDARVRLVAAYCLDETGGIDAAIAFARLALDSDGQVRGAALEGLEHHLSQVPPINLLEAYDQSKFPYVRQQLMLFAGKIPGVATPEIQKRYESEKDPQAKEGLVVALAGRGDAMAQREFIGALDAAKARDLARWLDYADQIAQPWLLPALLPILDDKSPVVHIGIDARPNLPQSLRACDLALRLAAKITGQRFSFPVTTGTNFTDQQLEEVKAYLRPLTAPRP